MNIFIVDDHPLVRQGLISVLSLDPSIKVIGQAENVESACEKIHRTDPDGVLIDLRLSDGSGLEIVVNLRKRGSRCKFIILTSSTDINDFQVANEIGVDGYILKEAFPEEIITAVKMVERGKKYYDPGIVELAMNRNGDGYLEELTPRELEVLKVLAKGMSNRDIARTLYISEYTVKKHVSQILAKLDLNDRTQAALYAASKKIV